MELELTSEHVQQYERDGYTIVKEGFQATECDQFVEYMMDLHAGRLAWKASAARPGRLVAPPVPQSPYSEGAGLDARSPPAPTAPGSSG